MSTKPVVGNLIAPQEVASQLSLALEEVNKLIKEGVIPAYRIGPFLRISEDELGCFLEECRTANRSVQGARPLPRVDSNERLCLTFAQRKRFKVRGSVTHGAEIWPGNARYPLKFSQRFFADLLREFGGREVKVGLSFDRPEPGSLGEWVKKKLNTRMNPTVYLAGLLIEEGYAERSARGVISFSKAGPPLAQTNDD